MTLAALGLGLAPDAAQGQTVNAMWDPNPETDGVTGYEVCIGASTLSCSVSLQSVTSTSHTFTPARGVLRYLAVRARNAQGVSGYSQEAVFSVPALVPPANQNSAIGVAISPLALSASDPDGGRLTYSATGLPLGLSLDPTTGRISGTPTAFGAYAATVTVTDGLSPDARSFTWSIGDPGAPTVTITSHASGATVTSANVTVSGTATDSGTGDSGIAGVTVNGGPATGGTASGSGTANWSRALTLATGANVVTVQAEDGGGNVRTAQITLNLAAGGGDSTDISAPLLTIGSHADGQTVTTTAVTLSGTASDRYLGGNGVASVRVNGLLATGGTANKGVTAKWSRALNLVKGANVITATAADKVGNVRTMQITINVK
jgi:hypothetical protein